MDITTKAIVIKKTEYRENTAEVILFTDDMGLVKVSAHGLHSTKNGMASATQLFTYGEFTLSERNGRYTAKSARIEETFGSLSATYDELCKTTRFIKAAMRLFGEGHGRYHDAFILLYSALSHLAYSDMDCDDIYIYFVLYATALSGQCPHITECAVCGKSLTEEKAAGFSPRHGGAVCTDCADCSPVSLLSLEAMRRMLLIPPAEIKKISLPLPVRTELLRILNDYTEYWF